ncbi:natural killer cell receptor 2B4-like isoform X1 [Misgurnus anguillicaudatus]|uniref:natural killer cell receptor 2B4-like isoform X1 n=1 Tax=Misgurnus anguillicaudatus TaxID=75329 RepID=UPI003CCFB942
MLNLRKLLLLCVIFVKGVFGVDGDEVKSVMEGDSVTLHTDITQIQTDQQILWLFGPQGTRIALIYKQHNVCDPCGSFKDGLKLDSQTGSLTITNITITDSGLYQLEIINSKETSKKTFNVTVYARLLIPDITCINSPFSSSSSSSKCVLLCSVLNVRDVSLSWYKGNSLLSSISVSDLNISLSLPLEVEYQDTNTYRCVLNNTITNQTQHLNIDDVCQTCSGSGFFWLCTAGAVILFLVAVAAATVTAAVAVYNRNEQSEQDIQEAKQIKKERILNFMEPVSVP